MWAINKLTEEFAQDDVETRAVSLCWMFHLIGDVHQPLHAVALFSKTYPKGDRGGTLQYIRARANAKPMSLHQLWDGLVIGSERFSTVKRDATSLKNNPNFVRSKLAELGDRDPKVWAENESAPLARKYAYLNGKLKTSKEESDTNAPILQDEYLIEAKAIAERRMALAAYRLVDHLRSLPR